jgi:hypothetical protein
VGGKNEIAMNYIGKISVELAASKKFKKTTVRRKFQILR